MRRANGLSVVKVQAKIRSMLDDMIEEGAQKYREKMASMPKGDYMKAEDVRTAKEKVTAIGVKRGNFYKKKLRRPKRKKLFTASKMRKMNPSTQLMIYLKTISMDGHKHSLGS